MWIFEFAISYKQNGMFFKKLAVKRLFEIVLQDPYNTWSSRPEVFRKTVVFKNFVERGVEAPPRAHPRKSLSVYLK